MVISEISVTSPPPSRTSRSRCPSRTRRRPELSKASAGKGSSAPSSRSTVPQRRSASKVATVPCTVVEVISTTLVHPGQQRRGVRAQTQAGGGGQVGGGVHVAAQGGPGAVER